MQASLLFRADCLNGLNFTCERFDFDWELVGKSICAGFEPLEVSGKLSVAGVPPRKEDPDVQRSSNLDHRHSENPVRDFVRAEGPGGTGFRTAYRESPASPIGVRSNPSHADNCAVSTVESDSGTSVGDFARDYSQSILWILSRCSRRTLRGRWCQVQPPQDSGGLVQICFDKAHTGVAG